MTAAAGPGLRLADYLLWRNAGHGEDPRQAAMRRYWGARFAWMSLFTVFALQGVLMWIVALSSPYGAWSAVGSVLMSFLLMRVSGVPMLERSIQKRRPDCVAYAARTSAFDPRPPKPAR